LVRSAYSVEFELPTWATVPGRVTMTGDTAVSVFVAPSAKNDPQRCTAEVTVRAAGRASVTWAAAWLIEHPAANSAAAATPPSRSRTGSGQAVSDRGPAARSEYFLRSIYPPYWDASPETSQNVQSAFSYPPGRKEELINGATAENEKVA
jgi:hypothetical protein